MIVMVRHVSSKRENMKVPFLVKTWDCDGLWLLTGHVLFQDCSTGYHWETWPENDTNRYLDQTDLKHVHLKNKSTICQGVVFRAASEIPAEGGALAESI